jgi:hypothetical protein
VPPEVLSLAGAFAISVPSGAVAQMYGFSTLPQFVPTNFCTKIGQNVINAYNLAIG